MQVKKQKSEPDMKQRTGFKLGKEYVKAVYCHPAYLTYVQSMEASLISQLVKNPPAMQETPEFDSWIGKIHWRRDRLPIPVFWPGELHGLYSSCGRKESDMSE